jgi:S1-C subfamily serine protease
VSCLAVDRVLLSQALAVLARQDDPCAVEEAAHCELPEQLTDTAIGLCNADARPHTRRSSSCQPGEEAAAALVSHGSLKQRFDRIRTELLRGLLNYTGSMLRHLLLPVLAVLIFAPAGHGAEQDAAVLFARYKDRIFQIRLVDLEAEEKAALGTGFLVARNGLIATNFHVISKLVNQPDQFRLEYVDEQGGKGDLQLLDVDVINDLALLKADDIDLIPLELPDLVPAQGDTIYSLGNPHDIGFTVIPGTYNGFDEGSYYRRIHFSGSINAGMSGGPVLDRKGRVVGVNVSSAGNQVSFLVPAEALQELIADWERQETPVADFRQRMRQQLVTNQKVMIDSILAEEWPTQTLGEGTVLGEMQPYVKCWGGSSEEKELYKYVSSSCRSGHAIYLGRGFSTGIIAYQFFWLEAHRLSTTRFMSYYEALFGTYGPDNAANEEDVGNFACNEFFISDEVEHIDKAVVCVRAYRKYAGLYDALYLRGSVDESEKAFISHFTLSGIERDTLRAFLERFQKVVRR